MQQDIEIQLMILQKIMIHHFERGKDPKESMSIGVTKDLIHINGITVEFLIKGDLETNSKTIHSSDWKEFLEMWESGRWSSKKLIRILDLRGFYKIFTKVYVKQISIKKRFIDENKMDLSGNYIECELGGGEDLFVSLAGRIYKLKVRKIHDGWWI